MNLNQAKTRNTDENQVARQDARVMRMRRRYHNHRYLETTLRTPALFTLRW